MLLPFTCSFMDNENGYMGDGDLTKVNSLYSDVVSERYGTHCWGRWKFNERIVTLRKLVKELKERDVCVFQKNFETELFTMNINVADHLHEDLDTFGSVRFLYASSYSISRRVLEEHTETRL